VPLWILMCLSLVGVLYSIIFAGILLRAPEVNPQRKRTSFNSALGYTFLVIPILIFQVGTYSMVLQCRTSEVAMELSIQ